MANLTVASSSYAQLAYIPETESGVTPTTGKGINLRMTGESLSQEISKETSKEINASRQTAGMFLTDAQVSGGVNFELSSGEYDPLIQAALMGEWSNFGNNGVFNAGNATFAAGAKTITFTTALPNIPVGAYFSVSGTGIKSENTGPFLVKAIDAAKKVITVDAKIADQQVTGAFVHHGRITNGVARRTFSVEKRFTDVNQTFLYRGMQVGKVDFSFDMRAALTGSFDFIGTTSVVGSGRMLGDKADYMVSKANPIIDSVIGMKNVLFDGQPVGDRLSAGITKLSLSYDNALSGHGGIGVLGNVGVTAGTIACSGTMEFYLNNASIYNSVLSQKRFRVEWASYDSSGHGYAFILPSVELASPKVNASQKDEAVMITVEFTALMDPATRQTIFIDRF